MYLELQSNFRIFHDKIKLNDLEQNRVLREKRGMLVQELQKWLRVNNKPSVTPFNQGSYAMGTGIFPSGDRDYDIDVGLFFDIDINDYDNPTVVKAWVEDALSVYPRTVEMKDACVRVQYHRSGEEHYHVDFAVYGYMGDSKYIAKGRRGSTPNNQNWEPSSPDQLKALINSKFKNPEERQQFKRIIRYLKKWKDVNFVAHGNGAPTGISLTAIAYCWFQPCFDHNGSANDLGALYSLFGNYIYNNYGLDIRLPVEPRNCLFEDIINSDNHTRKYKERVDRLYQALGRVCQSCSKSEAIRSLQQQFSCDFPS